MRFLHKVFLCAIAQLTDLSYVRFRPLVLRSMGFSAAGFCVWSRRVRIFSRLFVFVLVCAFQAGQLSSSCP